MAETFDCYYKWLGIPPEEQPPHYYRLLGVRLFEADADVIDSAANRQMAHVRTYQSGPQAALSQKLLNEISRARACLLDVKTKGTYDGELKKRQGPPAALSSGESSVRRPQWPDGKVPQTVAELQQCLAAIGVLGGT